MRFTLLAVAACGSMAMRPESGLSSAMVQISSLVSQITTRPSDSLAALKTAAGIAEDIFAQAGNATEYMSEDDATLLKTIEDLVEQTIYSSMDQSHAADEAALAGGVATAVQCNTDIAQRQSPDGDLGDFKQGVQGKQTELNRLQGVVDVKREANDTAWSDFDSHMQMISEPPPCPGLPTRNMGALDVFFESSAYSIWFAAQQLAFDNVMGAFTDADSALSDAIVAYELQKSVRDQQYCDWKTQLEVACSSFDTCFSSASYFFSNTLVPDVTSEMNMRILVKKAGDTVIHQIKFKLAEVNDQQTPPIDVSRYEIAFPDLPAKGLCDLSPLGDAMWVPTPSCDQGGPGKP